MIYRLIFTLGLIFTLTGCFRIGSTTKILIKNSTKSEYEEIKKEILNIITTLNPPFDCSYDNESWKANRDDGELICMRNFGNLYTELDQNSIKIVYNGEYNFLIPTIELIKKEIITEEHKKIQKLFLQLAENYHKKYKNSTVEVRFYHTDLSKGGRQLVKYENVTPL